MAMNMQGQHQEVRIHTALGSPRRALVVGEAEKEYRQIAEQLQAAHMLEEAMAKWGNVYVYLMLQECLRCLDLPWLMAVCAKGLRRWAEWVKRCWHPR